MSQDLIQTIATEVQLFSTPEQKANFLLVIGALVSRLISLKKAAEVLNLDPEAFLVLLELMGIEYSYLTEMSIDQEMVWE